MIIQATPNRQVTVYAMIDASVTAAPKRQGSVNAMIDASARRTVLL